MWRTVSKCLMAASSATSLNSCHIDERTTADATSGAKKFDRCRRRCAVGAAEPASVRPDVLAVDPAGHELAVLRGVMPDLAPAVAHERHLLPAGLGLDVEQVDAARAAASHLEHGPVRIGGLLLRGARRVFAHVQRVPERYVADLPRREHAPCEGKA